MSASEINDSAKAGEVAAAPVAHEGAAALAIKPLTIEQSAWLRDHLKEKYNIEAAAGGATALLPDDPTEFAALAQSMPAFIEKLNDAELRMLRDGLREIAREAVAHAELRRMVRQQFDLALDELVQAL